MNHKNCVIGSLLSFVFSVVLMSNIILLFPVSAEELLKDSGLNYTESTAYDLHSCDSGYTSAIWIRTQPGKNWTTSVTKYSLLLIGIGGYSSAMNNDGVDYDFDGIFFTSLEATLQSARANGATVGLRFRYDDNGTTNPEPAEFSQVLRHIEQIGESGLLEKYEDVISFMETGFVGSWGEQWGGKYTSLEYKAQVLDEFLNITPDSIPVLVRTPNTFRQWLSDYCGITTTAADMHYTINNPDLAAKAKRVGLYNDGYMGSDSDLGTYSNRAGETAWLSEAPSYGGEFSGSDEWRLKYTTWQPESALAEMYYTNLLRINGNIYRSRAVNTEYSTAAEAQARLAEIDALYEACGLGDYDYAGTVTKSDSGYTASWKWIGYDDFIFNKELDAKLGVSCDNSAFYGETVWQFIRAHLGYRYVLRSSALTAASEAGDVFNMEFSVENTGFSEAPKDKEVEVLLSDGVVTYTYTTDINARYWKSATLNEEKLSLTLPETMHGGEWNVYLRISNANSDAADDMLYCTRFANEDLKYDDTLCANYMGTVVISGEAAPEKEITEDSRSAGYYMDTQAINVDETETVNLLDKSYTFCEDGHNGFTFLYKIEGIHEKMQLGNWYTSFSINTTGYSSAYTTYGLNTRNQQITEDGYYALHVPFFGCAFNCQEASVGGNTTLNTFSFNDNRNYWSEDTYTLLGKNEGVQITPIAFVEGGPEGYHVTFHLETGDVSYSGSYGFVDTLSQSISNVSAVTALSLLDRDCPEQYVDEDGDIYKLLGFTTKKDDKSCIISEDFIAIGNVDLYPFYELDRFATNLNHTREALTNGADSQGVHYILDDATMTATVGDGSNWENNSGFGTDGSIIIPAYVISDEKIYMVTAISDNAFGSNTAVKDVTIPACVAYIGENAFYSKTVLYVYENSQTSAQLVGREYSVVYLKMSFVSGDVNADGSFDIADVVMMQKWILNIGSLVDWKAGDLYEDQMINVLDLCIMKRKLFENI